MLSLKDKIKRNKMNKRALSEIVAYALMISIALALSGMVYVFLKGVVIDDDKPICEEDVKLIIDSYNCTLDASKINLSITIKNNGLFNTDKFIIRVSQKLNAKIAENTLTPNPGGQNQRLVPGQKVTYNYSFDYSLKKVTIMDLQPIVNMNDIPTYCQPYTINVDKCP